MNGTRHGKGLSRRQLLKFAAAGASTKMIQTSFGLGVADAAAASKTKPVDHARAAQQAYREGLPRMSLDRGSAG